MNSTDFLELLVAEYGPPRKGIRLDRSFSRLQDMLDEAIVRYIIQRAEGNILEACRIYGRYSRTTMRKRLIRYGIDFEGIRATARRRD